jgi:dinuclear metal center YbgI/SA1388 family protein
MVKIQDITRHLESIAPPSYQESYDNAGLITGSGNWEVKGILCCLDAVEAVVDEAIERGCNLVVAHHPIVFRGLKRLNGKNYVERTIIKAIRHEVAIYAIHTNLDNVLAQGVNSKIAERLGLENTRILAPKNEMKKLSLHLPDSEWQALQPTWLAGLPGVTGLGHSRILAGQEERVKVEMAFASGHQGPILSALQSRVPGAFFELSSLENKSPEVGSGLFGELAAPQGELDFLRQLKHTMKTGCIRHTKLLGKTIKKVALCGGAGSFLLPQALGQGADVYITGDFKYHEFFDAEDRLVIADIGHFESEQFTIDLLHDLILEKFPNFAPLKTEVNTNPVNYL